MIRKEIAKNIEAYLIYLDFLRESGVINMLGAVPYLTENFNELTIKEARDILNLWMNTFIERQGE